MKKNFSARILVLIITILFVILGAVIISFKHSKSTDQISTGESVESDEFDPSNLKDGTYSFDASLFFSGDMSISSESFLSFDETLSDTVYSADVAWGQNDSTFLEVNTPCELFSRGYDILGEANENFSTDTINYLSAAGLSYSGAGYNYDKASLPVYMSTDNITIAYVSSYCASDAQVTSEATDDSAGIFTCFDSAALLEKIKEADEVADYVVFLPHWGSADQTEITAEQTGLAHACIDAGADAVIGTHAKNIMGMEIYNEKPILYSLGQFYTDEGSHSVVANLKLSGDTTVSGGGASSEIKEASLEIIPTTTDSNAILAADSEERLQIINSFKELSITPIEVSDDGVISY